MQQYLSELACLKKIQSALKNENSMLKSRLTRLGERFMAEDMVAWEEILMEKYRGDGQHIYFMDELNT